MDSDTIFAIGFFSVLVVGLLVAGLSYCFELWIDYKRDTHRKGSEDD